MVPAEGSTGAADKYPVQSNQFARGFTYAYHTNHRTTSRRSLHQPARKLRQPARCNGRSTQHKLPRDRSTRACFHRQSRRTRRIAVRTTRPVQDTEYTPDAMGRCPGPHLRTDVRHTQPHQVNIQESGRPRQPGITLKTEYVNNTCALLHKQSALPMEQNI
jgi:hypothetical protein